jgi:uncharacterized BrkB/YihY/UPF0761 family membrane protein
MEEHESSKDFVGQSRTVFPLFRYLVLQTETHAFCLALACAALIGFYPLCFLVLSLVKYGFEWGHAYEVVIAALREYYPTAQDFLVRNLETSVALSGKKLQVSSIFWILMGAAGVFIPLESGLNRLWKVQQDRPYWRNQLVGFTLTAVCCLLAVGFVASTASLQMTVRTFVPFDALENLSRFFGSVRRLSDLIVLKTVAVCFFSIAIFLFYKFLPNRKVNTTQVLPAAILAGIVAEAVKDVYVLVLPLMNIPRSQGPFYVSVSFVVLAYFETFVLLGGAFLATESRSAPSLRLIRKKPVSFAALQLDEDSPVGKN